MRQSNIYDEIADGLSAAAATLASGQPPLSRDSIRASLSRPANEPLGDLSSNLAFQLARPLKQSPLALAGRLAETFRGPAIASAAAPGFLNFAFTPERLRLELENMATPDWGTSAVGAGKRVHLEYVSANPTGPLHVGHGRGAVLGDTLARLLRRSGHEVIREYYLNDIGKQIEGLAASVLARARAQAGFETAYEIVYAGGYIDEVARAYREAGLPAAEHDAASRAAAAEFASRRLMDGILAELRRLSVEFDRITAESTLLPRVPELIAELRRRDLLYEAEQAEGELTAVRREDSKAAQHRGQMQGGTFLRTSRFGDETDRIILRKNGEPTYFTTDLLYHADKFRAGHDRVIDIWGADHGGHVGRMRAALRALDLPGERLEVVLCQMVKLLRAGQEVKMSKRTGEMITLHELMEEVGADAARFFFLQRSASAQCDFDLDLAVAQSADNPVFYCQYAHARTCQLTRKGEEEGLRPEAAHASRLVHPLERALMKQLAFLPEIARQAALRLEPHQLPVAAMTLAQALHRYQTAGKEDENLRIVRKEKPEESSARLHLVERVGRGMRWLLDLMGVSAPERM